MVPTRSALWGSRRGLPQLSVLCAAVDCLGGPAQADGVMWVLRAKKEREETVGKEKQKLK